MGNNVETDFSKLNINKLMEVLSEILSNKYGCKITMTAIPRDQATPEQLAEEAERKQKRAALLEKLAAEGKTSPLG